MPALKKAASAWEGGGDCGIAYLPIARGLREIYPEMAIFAGTSAGAINTVGEATRAPIDTLLRFVALTEFRRFAHYSPPGTLRLWRERGWYPRTFPEQWLGDLVELGGWHRDVTFGELAKRAGTWPIIVACRYELVDGKVDLAPFVFSPRRTPNVPIRLAALASMAVPFLWGPVPIEIDGETWWYCDGGLVANHPVIYLLTEGPAVLTPDQVVGVRLDDPGEIRRRAGTATVEPVFPSLSQMTTGMVRCMRRVANATYVPSALWERGMIVVDIGAENPLDFDVTPAARAALLAAGDRAFEEWRKRVDVS